MGQHAGGGPQVGGARATPPEAFTSTPPSPSPATRRSLLRQGRQCRTLWPAVGESTGTKDAPPMSPVGTTACNPNVNQAVSLYVELDTYAHPVACPTGGWKTT